MYSDLGQNLILPDSTLVGIFDLDNTTWSFRTRRFLDQAEAEGRVTALGVDLPRSFLITQEGQQPAQVYITSLSTAALQRRMEESMFQGGK